MAFGIEDTEEEKARLLDVLKIYEDAEPDSLELNPWVPGDPSKPVKKPRGLTLKKLDTFIEFMRKNG